MRNTPKLSYISASILTGLFLSGCATTYDPAEVCTAEWIKPRAERAVRDIEKETKSALKTLKKSGNSFSKGRTPGPLQLIKLTSAISKLTNELQNGRGIKDLRILRNTCDDPKIVSGALTDFMKDQGLPDKMIDFIQNLEIYQDVIDGESTQPDQT